MDPVAAPRARTAVAVVAARAAQIDAFTGKVPEWVERSRGTIRATRAVRGDEFPTLRC
jgi:hypothetical protein